MDMTVKICGLSTVEAIIAARDGGATHLGFIFFEPSPRNVSAQRVSELLDGHAGAKAVAVSVNADDDFLEEIVSSMQPDMLQLHGGETVERVEELKARFGLPVMKALAIREAADIEKARAYDDAADMLLLDAKPPNGSDLPGGNGASFDWSLIDTLKTQTPILLSGGIDIDNLPAALDRVVDPRNSLVGIDLSSGVEYAPGVKDLAKIAALLKACRNHQTHTV
ncbi:MAG: phosphoribosylanthranilate isomerase [Rhizobiaceae bacterium]